MIELPFSEACERNKDPIANALADLIRPDQHILEIGSGTGQHGVHLATRFSSTIWQCSDVTIEGGLAARIAAAALANLPPPIRLAVGGQWPDQVWDGIFTANTLHIMPAGCVPRLFDGLAARLSEHGWLVVYGPFKRDGRFVSDGDERLDAWARASFPGAGIRDLESVVELAENAGFSLDHDIAMPANNRLLVIRPRRS